ncbi:MAG: hypothetical protein ACXAAT_11585 [Candidatus Hodarchaeales archaeon]
MEYVIHTYREEYLDDHVRIETNERKRWDIIVRPDKEQVKTELTQRYSQLDFDPETSLSAFKGDEMIGFITSSIYEEDSVTKGTMVSEYWGETVSVAKRNRFKFDKDFVIQSQKRYDEIDEKKLVESKDVESFNYQKHGDAVAKLLKKQYNVSEEEAKRVVDRFKDWEIGTKKNYSGVPQRLVTHGLIIDNEEVVGRHLGFQQDLSGKKTTDLSIYARNNDKEILGQLLTAGIKESKNSGMEVLHIGLLEPTEELKEFYSSYGLVFRTAAAYYTKELGI